MAKKKSKDEKPHSAGPRIANRKAWHDFQILEVLECGLELTGTEVKSLRAGQAQLDEGFARVRGGQLVLVGVNIATYPQAGAMMQHEPLRERRLLVHRRQIKLLEMHVKQKGKTIVPLAIYFKGGWAKCEVGLAIGKKFFDKRQDLKKKDQQREMNREMNKRR